MAETVRLVMAAIKIGAEALTPTTDAAKTFLFLDEIRAGHSAGDIPATVKHRMIRAWLTPDLDTTAVASSRVVYDVTFTMELFHIWIRANYYEARIIHAEDVMMLNEYMRFTKPGSAVGARSWRAEPGAEPDQDGVNWITTLTYSGRLGLTNVVTP